MESSSGIFAILSMNAGLLRKAIIALTRNTAMKVNRDAIAIQLMLPAPSRMYLNTVIFI